jgi:Plasmid pRiA4b ORF-3-like protein
LKKGQVFYYLFDFGDEWWHEITVEEIEANAEKGRYPRVLEQKGKSPPQICL